MRTTAFLTRSIRQDSRTMSHHLMRFLMTGMILYLFSVEWAVATRRVAPGALFATTVMTCCYWFLTLLGGVHFSSAITEEVEEQTLPLLKMTGASPFTILIGKSLPRLGVAVLFLISATPFLVLALTLGGVLPIGLAAAALGMFCYAVMLSQLGLLSSVVSRNTRQAFLLTGVGWAVIELSHWWYELFNGIFSVALRNTPAGEFGSNILQNWLYWVPSCSLCGNLSESLLTFETTSTPGSELSVFEWIGNVVTAVGSVQVVADLALSLVFFFISWVCFEPLTSRVTSRGGTTPVPAASRSRSRRATGNALAWKTHYFVAGGRRWFWIRLMAIPAGIFAFCVALIVIDEHVEVIGIAVAAVWLGIPFFVITISRLLGIVFAEEIHQKTLPALLMLPQSSRSIAAAMVRGLAPSAFAAAFCFLGGVVLFLIVATGQGGWGDASDVFQVLVEPTVWHMFSLLLLTLHIGVLLSTHLRYGGMVVAFVLVFMTTCCSVPVIGEVVFSSGDIARYFTFIVLILVELFFCGVIQVAIVRRLEELAAK